MILVLSEIDWSYIKQRHQIFSEKLAQNEQVVYLGRVGLRLPTINEIITLLFKIRNSSKYANKAPENIELLNTRLFLPPLNNVFRLYNKLIIRILFKSKKNSISRIIFYQPTSLTFDICNYINPVIVHYDCVQDYRFHPRRSVVSKWEENLVNRATFITADSVVNFERLKHTNKVLVPPGINCKNFDKIKPSEYNGRWKCVYYGNIRDDLDFDLIEAVASMDNVELRLIGPLNTNYDFSSNCRLLPPVSFEEIGGVLNSANIILLPYKTNDFTRAILPAKFFECIASNRPIIYSGIDIPLEYKDKVFHISEFIDNPLIVNNFNTKIFDINQFDWSIRFQSFYGN
jgi:hypothetical protein